MADDLYPLYRAYALRVYRGDESCVRDRADFMKWLESLRPAVRAAAEANYRRGYDTTVAAGAAEILEQTGDDGRVAR